MQVQDNPCWFVNRAMAIKKESTLPVLDDFKPSGNRMPLNKKRPQGREADEALLVFDEVVVAQSDAQGQE